MDIENNRLPEGWKVVTLKDVCEKAQTVKRAEKNPADELLYLDISSVDNERNKIVAHKTYQWKDAPSRAQQIVKVGDVLFSTVRTYLRNIAPVTDAQFNNQIASTGFTVIRGNNERVDSKFLLYYVLSEKFLRPLNELQTGTSYPAVRDKDVFAQHLPLPPLPDQHRIVAKIEELFSELDAGKQELEKAAQRLKVYRQAVLKWAFEGKLTNEAVVDGELPEGWKWKSLGTLCDPKRKCAYGVLVPGDHIEDGITLLRVGDIDDKGGIDQNNMKRIAPEIAARFKRTSLEGGEVAISLVGAIGRTAVIPKSLNGANTARAVGVIPVADNVSAEFIEMMLRSPAKIQEHSNSSHEVARKTLNLEDVIKSRVPVPPLTEQLRIVAEVESRLSICTALEESILKQMHDTVILQQSILKTAFEGKFVSKC